MSNFSKRLIFGIVYVLLIVAATTTNNYLFFGLFYIFMLFAVYEFQKMINLVNYIPYIFGTLLFSSTLLHQLNLSIIANTLYIIAILVVFISFIFTLLDESKIAVNHLGKLALTILYTIIPFILLVKLAEISSPLIVLGIFILTWTSDTFAYLVGRQFGKHKLFERISPKKTIEGFVGGIVFTLIAAYILAIYFNEINLIQWLIIAIIISVFGVLGDLIESMFKRQANVKDSSNLIPGHGGFLDRLDSIIFAIPFIYAFIYLTNLNLSIHVS